MVCLQGLVATLLALSVLPELSRIDYKEAPSLLRQRSCAAARAAPKGAGAAGHCPQRPATSALHALRLLARRQPRLNLVEAAAL